jgi:hypothetical protein
MPITLTDLDLILVVCFGGVASALMVFLAYFLFPFDNRLKFLNKLTRGNKGVVEVAGKGNEIDKYVVDFNRRVGETKHKVFNLDPDCVYMKNGIKTIHFNELDALDPVQMRGQPIPKDKLAGVLKVAGLIDKDIREELTGEVEKSKANNKYYLFPVSYRKLKPKEQYKNPEMIKGVFMEQKALAEAKALTLDKMIKYLCIAAAFGGGLAFVTGFMNSDKIDNQVLPAISDVSSAVASLQTAITNLQVQQSISTGGNPIVLPNGTVINTGGSVPP